MAHGRLSSPTHNRTGASSDNQLCIGSPARLRVPRQHGSARLPECEDPPILSCRLPPQLFGHSLARRSRRRLSTLLSARRNVSARVHWTYHSSPPLAQRTDPPP